MFCIVARWVNLTLTNKNRLSCHIQVTIKILGRSSVLLTDLYIQQAGGLKSSLLEWQDHHLQPVWTVTLELSVKSSREIKVFLSPCSYSVVKWETAFYWFGEIGYLHRLLSYLTFALWPWQVNLHWPSWCYTVCKRCVTSYVCLYSLYPGCESVTCHFELKKIG